MNVNNSSLKRDPVVVGIIVAGIMLSCVTALFGCSILPDYQDKLIHLRRIAALADTIHSGYYPARIYFVMNGDTGYAMPVFYPDMNLYLPAQAYITGVPLSVAYSINVIVINAITALCTYYSVKGILEIFFPEEKRPGIYAAVCTFVYQLSVYRLTNVYIRDAAGEYTAMAFLPLVIWGMVRVLGKEKNVLMDAMPLGIGMSFLVCSHILTTVMIIPFLVLAVIVFIKKALDGGVLARIGTAILICVSLTAFFWVPMIDYMLSDDYRVDESSYIMRGFYPGWRELLEIIPSGSGSGIAYELRMPTALGISLVSVLAVWFIHAVFRVFRSIKTKRSSVADRTFVFEALLFVMSGIALFLSSKYFPWTRIEETHGFISRILCSVQFSWRYIEIATVTSVVLGGMELVRIARSAGKAVIPSICVLMILAVVPGIVLEVRACTENRKAFIREGREIGIVGDELYLPLCLNTGALENKEPVVVGDVTVSGYEITNHKWNLAVSSGAEGGEIYLPVVYYKGYVSVTDKYENLETVQSPDGRVVVRIPGGFDGNVEMSFSEPFLWRVAEVVTFFAILILVIFSYGPAIKAGKK